MTSTASVTAGSCGAKALITRHFSSSLRGPGDVIDNHGWGGVKLINSSGSPANVGNHNFEQLSRFDGGGFECCERWGLELDLVERL